MVTVEAGGCKREAVNEIVWDTGLVSPMNEPPSLDVVCQFSRDKHSSSCIRLLENVAVSYTLPSTLLRKMQNTHSNL